MKKILYTLLIVPLLGFAQDENPCYSINDIFIQMDGENPSLEVNLVAGWNMIGYPCTQDMLLTDGFSSVDDKISMVKNNNGAVYIPEFNFNGIGFLESGQGYQVKMNEFVMDFSFCESVQYPNLEGCTDCEASNFNQLANVDDGSCNYDSDGDGVIDSEEVVGCQDSLACDYNINATDSGECFYAQDGYDCDGNITAEIGDEIEGGYLFYVDETGTRGMVAAMEDVSEDALWWFYAMDSLDNFISNSQYNDWYVPRRNELELMYSSFGDESTYVDFNFSSWYSYWSATQNENLDHWVLGFNNGSSGWINSANTCLVRPIRAFGNWAEGCMDSLACNFNTEANMADGSCEYADQGYDCEGNINEYLVGMEAEGGIVFYVDETGERGLVAAMEDLEGYYQWGCSQTELSGADGTSIGTGYQNTLDIVSGCSETPIAASEALAYESEGYSDWYLPSKDELIEMHNTIGYGSGNIGGFILITYWSSSDYGENGAWMIYSSDVGAGSNSKLSTEKVRVIRAFGDWTMGCIDSLACNYNPEANMSDGNCEYADLGYDCDGNITAEIGDEIEGGYLFYVDETGTRGMVAAMEDVSEDALWWFYAMDSLDNFISNSQYNDWYVPRRNELELMYSSFGDESTYVDFNFSSWYSYWSTTQNENLDHWVLGFNNGSSGWINSANTCLVRPIRAFGNWAEGCMDSIACNYNPVANMADGSCEYTELGYDCDGNINEYLVGMEAEGGIVFYVDSTGQRGLVAAMEDTEGFTSWGCGIYDSFLGADGTSIGTGYQNTLNIVAGCEENGGITAAQAALVAEVNGYSDWYLPSIDELNEMYSTIGNGGPEGNIGGFSSSWYWSSSEYIYPSSSWIVNFDLGFTDNSYSMYSGEKVRVIRSF